MEIIGTLVGLTVNLFWASILSPKGVVEVQDPCLFRAWGSRYTVLVPDTWSAKDDEPLKIQRS